MSEQERIKLLDTLIQLIVQFKDSCSPSLQPAERQLLQTMDWATYDYQAEGLMKSTSVYSFLYKAYYELCLGATILTSGSPYYTQLETMTKDLIATIQKEGIRLDRLPLASTMLSGVNTQAHTRLSNLTSGNLSYVLSVLAKLIFL